MAYRRASLLYVSVEAIVQRRPEIVWGVLTDISGATSWIEGLVEATTEDETPKQGTSIRVRRRSSGVALPKTAFAEITVWKPPSLLVLETRATDLLLLDRISLAPTSEGTLVTVASELRYGNALAALLTRPSGVLLGSGKPHPVDGIYERSVESLIKRVEMVSASPFR